MNETTPATPPDRDRACEEAFQPKGPEQRSYFIAYDREDGRAGYACRMPVGDPSGRTDRPVTIVAFPERATKPFPFLFRTYREDETARLDVLPRHEWQDWRPTTSEGPSDGPSGPTARERAFREYLEAEVEDAQSAHSAYQHGIRDAFSRALEAFDRFATSPLT